MVAAGIAFALINAISYKVTSSPDYGGLGFKSQSDLFWQYGIALLFAMPFLFTQGIASLRTTHPVLHVVRVILSVIGLQAFNLAFSYGEPTWKVVALVMTSPFFVMLGAKFLLGETVGPNRWLASIVEIGRAHV